MMKLWKRKPQTPKTRNKWAKWGRTAFFLLTSLAFALSLCIYAAAKWISANFGISFEELVFTLAAPLKGADTSLVGECVRASTLELKLIAGYIILGAVVLFFGNRGVLLLSVRFYSWRREYEPLKLLRRCMALVCAATLAGSLWFANAQFQIVDFLKARMSTSTLYEDYYIDPNSVEITGSGKNLIYIYMESMETTYASQAVGGWQPEINYIPNLTALAQENLSFSNSTQLGGFHPIAGATNTISSLFATSSGIPYYFPITENTMGKYEAFASGVTNLGDILEAKGYQNEFLCGSKADFAGRRDFFTQHGNFKVFDYYTAQEEGYIAEGYHVWWGYEDEILYKIAKDELTDLAQSGQPFNFTMLTVDTHHIDGYLCSLCGDEYPSTTANVVACADRQIADFIAWCQEQDFYEDTLIVITGDHPRMDTSLVDGVAYYDRTVYNCIFNCALPARTTNREFTAMDLFPTVLTAMGFHVEGDKLGLGTNLFSDQPTLCETMGYDVLQGEIGKHSAFYVKNFA